MEEFRNLFEAYGGDYQATMDRFLGNEAMYLKFLDMLFEDESFPKLCEAIETEDMTAAFEAAHTLKGIVSNMGLTPLFDAVCVMVEPLRTGERRTDYPVLLEAVRSEFQRVEKLREDLGGQRA